MMRENELDEVGTSNEIVLPLLPRTPPTSVAAFVPRKFRPAFVTRTDAAFLIVLVGGNPPASGWTPQLEQPLEQPPPLQEAIRRKRTTTTACRHQERSMGPRNEEHAREEISRGTRQASRNVALPASDTPVSSASPRRGSLQELAMMRRG
jgi:hypothetical protein